MLRRRCAPGACPRAEPVPHPAITAELAAGTGEKEIKTKALARLTVPTSWLVGTDSAPEFATAARRAAATSSAIRLVEVPRAGHAIQLDNPAAVVTALE